VAAGALPEDAGRSVEISAFAASLNQRCSKLRELAAISGDLANLARRAHSAAWSRQYFA
jgi:hypothetical protein